jgi:2-alkenal reductase
VPGSPADRAGLRGVDARAGVIGDIIVAVEDTPVRRLSDLTDRLERTAVGETVSLTILRDNRRERVDVAVVDVGEQGPRARRP